MTPISRRTALFSAVLLAAASFAVHPVAGARPWDPASAGFQWHTLDVGQAMDAIGLAPGMIVGEAGAGDGYFTFPMIQRIGPGGAIYANDIDERALGRLHARSEREGYHNIHTVVGQTDDPLFPRTDLEMVVVVHALHDFSRPVEWMVNLKKYLRPGGTLAVIDIDPARGGDRHFLQRGRILQYASQAGYDVVKAVDDRGNHLFIVLRPKAA